MQKIAQGRSSLYNLAFLAGSLGVAVLAGAVIVLWSSPIAPVFVIGIVLTVAVALFLLQRPLLALCVSLFIVLMPIGLRIEGVYDVAMNLSLLLALIAFLVERSQARRKIHWNVTCIAILLYMAWACVTMLWSPDLGYSRQKIVAYAIGVIFLFLMTNQIRNLKAVDAVMLVLAMLGWILAIGGIHAMIFGTAQPGERLKILEMNQNLFGTVLVLMLPGAIWPVLRTEGIRRRIYMGLSIVFILCSLILVAMTGSRGSALSLVIVLLGFWFWRPMRPWGIIGVGLVLGMLLVAPFLLETLLYRLETNEGGELGGRGMLWEASFLLLKDYPLTGTGVGNGPPGLHWYISSLSSEVFTTRRDLPSHNPILEAGVETGLIGAFLYMCICASALFQFLRSRRATVMQSGPLAAYFPLLLGTAAGYVTAWFKGGGMEVHPTFFVLLGLLLIPSQLAFEAERR